MAFLLKFSRLLWISYRPIYIFRCTPPKYILNWRPICRICALRAAKAPSVEWLPHTTCVCVGVCVCTYGRCTYVRVYIIPLPLPSRRANKEATWFDIRPCNLCGNYDADWKRKFRSLRHSHSQRATENGNENGATQSGPYFVYKIPWGVSHVVRYK